MYAALDVNIPNYASAMAASGSRRWRAWRWRRRRLGGQAQGAEDAPDAGAADVQARVLELTQLLAEMAVVEASSG